MLEKKTGANMIPATYLDWAQMVFVLFLLSLFAAVVFVIVADPED